MGSALRTWMYARPVFTTMQNSPRSNPKMWRSHSHTDLVGNIVNLVCRIVAIIIHVIDSELKIISDIRKKFSLLDSYPISFRKWNKVWGHVYAHKPTMHIATLHSSTSSCLGARYVPRPILCDGFPGLRKRTRIFPGGEFYNNVAVGVTGTRWNM
jgi:hypothetical protein